MGTDTSGELDRPRPELTKLSQLWKTIDNVGWLKDYYSEQLRARNLQEARENPYTALSRLGTESVKREIKQGHFIIASASAGKLQLISEIVQENGYVGEPLAFVDEEAQKELALSIAKRWRREIYPLAVVAGKLSDVKSQAFATGKTIISVDSIVIGPGGQILEKPKSSEDLVRMLNLGKGKRVKVVVGAGALVPIKYGLVAMRLDEGAEIAIKLRDLTVGEVNQYVGENLDSALGIAGGIDFSSRAGQNLIDQGQPIEVRPLAGTVYSLYFKNKDLVRQPVKIDPRDVDQLADYFKGAPKEIIGILMQQSKELQEKVERL